MILSSRGEEIKKAELNDLLKHVIINKKTVEELSKEEFKNITCWAGSHYEIKDEYKNRDDVQYQIEYKHDRKYMQGKKTIHKKDIVVFDAKIRELEKEIRERRKKKGDNIKRHDEMMIRQYINMAYIAKENPKAQLEVTPPLRKDE
jgi:hypothetical protein